MAERVERFFIPARNNTIAKTDIDKGYLKITSDNKEHFPEENCDDLILVINGVEHVCSLHIKGMTGKDDFYIVNVGKDVLRDMGLRFSDILDCERVDEKKYIVIK
jgi:hypothetical protein